MPNLSSMKLADGKKTALVTAASCLLVLGGAAPGGYTAAADTVPVADPFKPCMAKAATTAAMEACIIAERVRAEAELDTAFQQLITKMDASREALLVKAQQRWIAYRVDECEFAASLYAGGSLAPVVGGICLNDLTVQRTKDLRKHLGEL